MALQTRTLSVGSPSRGMLRSMLAGVVLAATAVSSAAAASPPEVRNEALPSSLRAAVSSDAHLGPIYSSRGYQPLWISNGSLRPEADKVVGLIARSRNDGFDPAAYNHSELIEAVRRARDGSPASLARAEILLSRAFSNYARDLRRPRKVEMLYVDPELAPGALTPRAILAAAAEATSLASYIDSVTRMNPIYSGIRQAYADYRAANTNVATQEFVFRANLERARALPLDLGRKFILVDAASARLWMYENGAVADSMRVIVGRESEQTPLMAAFVRFAAYNPYWNVPPDLVQRRIAPEVLSQGLPYLNKAKYQVLSSWSEDANVVDPRRVDWEAVAAGRTKIAVRQAPGAQNAMGKVKFMFPNERGVYLHDTPDKSLFRQSGRHQSSGCVRVEDAARLSRWLFHRDLALDSAAPEQRVSIPEPVPVYITYLTVMPERNQLAFQEDVYLRDRRLVAQINAGPAVTGAGFAAQGTTVSVSPF